MVQLNSQTETVKGGFFRLLFPPGIYDVAEMLEVMTTDSAAMVLRLSTVKFNSGTMSSSSPGKSSSSWSSGLLFRYLLQESNKQQMSMRKCK
ncbi:hypothetical protein FQN60_010745, partial [Etheostoma spectabile]